MNTLSVHTRWHVYSNVHNVFFFSFCNLTFYYSLFTKLYFFVSYVNSVLYFIVCFVVHACTYTL
jgi:hypothetical protein